MQRMISSIGAAMLAVALVVALAPPAQAQARLQGSAWIAVEVNRDGKPAADVLGHRLSFDGPRFAIHASDGTLVYAGTFRTDPRATPAAIDFKLTHGAPRGTVWKGIYALSGDTLTTCDNAPNLRKPRPRAFDAPAGSGAILITFTRAPS